MKENIINIELCEWQRSDPKTGLIQPWLTHDFLDWAAQQDWKDKNIIMFGAGLGDAWLANKCKQLFVVERNIEWLNKAKGYCKINGIENVVYLFRPCDDCSGNAAFYTELPDGICFDIIINDDAYRNEVLQTGIDHLNGRGGLLIADNFNQDFVWISPAAIELMEPYKETEHIFYQSDHINHEGLQWNTRYWIIK